MPDVANDRDDEVVEAAFVAAHRQQVEQALRRMRNVRFAGVEDADVLLDVPGDIGGHARTRVPHDHDVDAVGSTRRDADA